MRELTQNDIVGHRIRRIWQTVELNPGRVDHADHVFELDNGVLFRLPGRRVEPLTMTIAPGGAELWNRPEIEAIRQSPIADICCPEDDDYVNVDNMFILLESGLWIYQETGAPHGTLDLGLFTSNQCPEECRVTSYFRLD